MPEFLPQGSVAAQRVWPGLVTATFLAVSAAGSPLWAEALPPRPPSELPSAQVIEPFDMALEDQPDGQLWLVMRYLAPRIARDSGDLGYDAVVADLDMLCEGPGREAAGWAAAQGALVDQIVVVLVDRPTERGVVDPQATSFMSAYRIAPEGCVWQ